MSDSSVQPYSSWPEDRYARWVHASNTFGRHLMQFSRDFALRKIPEDATERERQLAEKAARAAISGMMMMLDGVSVAEVDEGLWFRCVLHAQVVSAATDELVEEFELAPDGDGLCMGLARWVENDFSD